MEASEAPAVESSVTQDWSEPEAAEEPMTQDAGKRNKRRRRKGKGGGQSSPAESPSASEQSAADPTGQTGEPALATPPQPRKPQQHPPRPKADPELLAKFAWKIYLAEISEEGVALVGDNDARDLARRCFRLAEIFLDEQTRRR